ncbi:Cytosolic carboxypeptidase 2 isoform 1 [Schistosoma japonicum]|uniref:Cytosolic carboxypeptidase 2 isoform 1 n=1 Tax=Schistosoma japonicum TaxID=6182 RepID=A0A4Z2CZ28_SCHJA|nr:Cytosolic carboxypeptidase 2 isoform 1 [Schistosoma japonicum]
MIAETINNRDAFSTKMLESSGNNNHIKKEWIEKVLRKPKDVLKTRQIYYSLLNNGKMSAKLSRPKAINYDHWISCKPNLIRWPLNFEIIPERIFHINKPPPQRERLYKPTGNEIQPAMSGEYNNDNHKINTIVFQYEPMIGKFFTTSKIDGNIGQSTNLPNDFNFLKFESRFECGNLSKAICTGPYEYELYLRPDLYTKKYTQWFYFRVQNTENVNSYRFTIVNFYKSTSLFGQGMRPLMYSEKMATLNGIGWRRVGTEINYYQTKFMELTAKKLQFKSKSQKDDAYKLQHAYSLTWKFTFPYPNDTVYFAACYPYTYTQLREYLNQLALDSSIQKICQQTILCYTLANNPVPLLTITEPYDYDNDNQNSNKLQSDTETQSVDAPNNNKPLVKKRCVVVTARVHPGETQGSWMMKGLMDFLISTDPDAKVLRSNFMFKLVPMLNPDGVIVGNYRCSLSGCDLNRKYTSSLKRFFPTIWHTKQMIANIMKEYEVVVYCDLHGHSRKQQMFIYGCKSQTPEKQYCSRIFPAMLGKNIPELFNFDKCKFAVQKEKEGTGRIVMWKEGITNSYTLEATFCGTTGNELEEGYHFNSIDFEKMGSQFCDTLLDYIDPDHSKMEHIMEYLKNRSISLKMSKVNESEDGLFTSDDSGSDSSDVGSDSSNCDELPAYYAYVLQKSKKKGKSKRQMSQKREARSTNKKETQSKKDAGTNHCVACCRDLNLTEENPKSRKQTPNKSKCKKPSKIESSDYQTSLGNRQNGYVSDGDISFKRNCINFYSTTGKHVEPGTISVILFLFLVDLINKYLSNEYD